MVSEREIESDRMFNQMLLTDAEKAFMDRVWPRLQNGCYRTHGSIPVEIRGLNFDEFVRDGLCAVLSAAQQPSGKIEKAAQIIQAFIDQGVDYIMRNNKVEEALHHLKIIEGEANRVTNPVTKNNLLYEIERIRSALTAGKPEQAVPSGLTIRCLQAAHVERQEEWCPDQKPDLSFRGNEMAGEVGEACNIIKKLERERHGWRGSRATRDQLADELADVVHTAVLCAITAGLDLESAVVAKFNTTSEKNGLATLLPTPPTAGGGDA